MLLVFAHRVALWVDNLTRSRQIIKWVANNRQPFFIFTTMNLIEHAKRTLIEVAKENREVILFYSGGKDSITILDMAAPLFDKIYCVFMYFVEGLQHQEIFLRDAAARYPNVEIVRVPHFNLSAVFKYGLYCNPTPDLRQLDLSDVEKAVRSQLGNLWIMYGAKKVDGLNRRLMLGTYENDSIMRKTKKAYPLSLWKNKDVLAYIKHRKLPSPVNYGLKTPSAGVTLKKEVLVWLRDRWPQDLKKILNAFPEAEVLLYEQSHTDRKVAQSERLLGSIELS